MTSSPSAEYVRSPPPTSTATPAAPRTRSRTARRRARHRSHRLRPVRIAARDPRRGDDEGPGDPSPRRRSPRARRRWTARRRCPASGPDAEGGNPVAELVEGDHPARRGSRECRELFLAEADRERQEGRAPEAGEAEGERSRAPARRPGKSAMSTNAPASTNGSTWYVNLGGNDALHGGEQEASDGHHAPERRQRQGGLGRRGTELAVMSSCDQLPFTVSQIAVEASRTPRTPRTVGGSPGRDARRRSCLGTASGAGGRD